MQGYIDIMLQSCHTPTKKVQSVMLDTPVQCHIDMIIYNNNITFNVGMLLEQEAWYLRRICHLSLSFFARAIQKMSQRVLGNIYHKQTNKQFNYNTIQFKYNTIQFK